MLPDLTQRERQALAVVAILIILGLAGMVLL
jgi:hypothetical protein